MVNHYYSEKPNVGHDEKIIKSIFHNREFIFKTDAGVFSKNRVDFGSSLLIETFPVPNEAKILDLGCGYGPIGIIISSQLSKGEVHLVDINERAIELAKHNLITNQHHIGNNIEVYVKQSDGFTKIEERDFNYILLNPPIRAGKKLIHELFEQSYHHLSDKGELWIVIQKKQGAPSAIKKLEATFSQVDIVEKKKGYFIIKSTK
ncbi:16S rRNA methyltransferase [Vulcanibacillus modesticaldus]|uniref:16S rRNA methyltransferase n=1 Tax=Vulcanibacillus modesticaldus TaxID=337097 RepID=A0A1D2YS08_9BACI|nr:class I SAM-dependent methyltransferase [Vulcanibacillus modesticaldus]OEF96407.1 16S rRNA methyltransferase [Vulcanibacillus modesticaldus]